MSSSKTLLHFFFLPSCPRIIVSHVYPYQWESNCRGVLNGYSIWKSGECHRGKWTWALFIERCQSPDQHLHEFIEKKKNKTKQNKSVRAIFVWSWKMVSVSVRYLFNQPMDNRIRTWTLRFPTKENPNMEKALIDWPTLLQYDVKAKYQLISRKFTGMKLFSLERSLDQPKATRFCIRLINQSNRSISVRVLFLFCSAFSFQGHAKIALSWRKIQFPQDCVDTQTTAVLCCLATIISRSCDVICESTLHCVSDLGNTRAPTVSPFLTYFH